MKPINQLIEELRELGSKYKYPFSVRWAPRNGIAIPDSTEKKNYAPANELETMLNAMPRILEYVEKLEKEIERLQHIERMWNAGVQPIANKGSNEQ